MTYADMRRQYYERAFRKIIGGTVTNVIEDNSTDPSVFGLNIKTHDRNYSVFFVSDEEGNGAGHAEVYETM